MSKLKADEITKGDKKSFKCVNDCPRFDEEIRDTPKNRSLWLHFLGNRLRIRSWWRVCNFCWGCCASLSSFLFLFSGPFFSLFVCVFVHALLLSFYHSIFFLFLQFLFVNLLFFSAPPHTFSLTIQLPLYLLFIILFPSPSPSPLLIFSLSSKFSCSFISSFPSFLLLIFFSHYPLGLSHLSSTVASSFFSSSWS